MRKFTLDSDYAITHTITVDTVNTATQTETATAWTLQEFACAECGGSLTEGYEERHYGIDSETGYSDVWLVCGACCERERDEQDNYNGPDALYEAKCAMEMEDCF